MEDDVEPVGSREQSCTAACTPPTHRSEGAEVVVIFFSAMSTCKKQTMGRGGERERERAQNCVAAFPTSDAEDILQYPFWRGEQTHWAILMSGEPTRGE